MRGGGGGGGKEEREGKKRGEREKFQDAMPNREPKKRQRQQESRDLFNRTR